MSAISSDAIQMCTAATPEVIVASPSGPAAERYRVIAARLDGMLSRLAHEPGRVVLVTSPGVGDGKTTTALHVGAALADSLGRATVVVDADLRSPRIAELLRLAPAPGLGEVACGENSLDAVLRRAGPGPLHLVAGTGAGTHASVDALAPVFDVLRERFDYVVVDTPALAASAQAPAIARICDGVLLVARARATKRDALAAALETLGGVRILGCVLNDGRGGMVR